MTDNIDLDGLVRAMRGADPADVPEMMASAAATLGGRDVVLYLVDFEQRVLEPLPDHSTHEELPHSEEGGRHPGVGSHHRGFGPHRRVGPHHPVGR
jgi:hypothetical protein